MMPAVRRAPRPRAALLPPLLLAAALAAAAGVPAPAAGDDASRTVLVRGRVTDAAGWPVRGVPVVAEGSAAEPSVTDGQGGYAIRLPLPAPARLAREPLRVRFVPRREGWSFARAGGRGPAGLEIDIVGPPARARVRAPDAAFAHAVARALAGEATLVFADLDLRGAPGDGAAGPVEMTAQEEVPVRGVRVPRRAEAPAPATSAAPERAPAPPPAKAQAESAPPAPAPATRAPDARAAGRARRDAERIAREQREQDRRAATAEEKQERRRREDSLRTAGQMRRDAERPRAWAAVPEAPATSGPAPAGARTDSLAAAERAARAAALAATRRQEEERRAAERAHVEADLRARKARQDSAMTAWRARRDSSNAAMRDRRAAEARAWRERQDSMAASRRASEARRSAVTAPARGGDCACTIQGTIEARSERRIPEYLKVRVWVADRPAAADSVELFMGSPRPFAMRVPCGTHRLELVVEPRLNRFAVGPPEAFADFRCGSERPSQWRLVLEVP
jgi:hypothetical protein